MAVKIPLLLSFYALSNGKTTLAFGQVTYTRLKDLSFTAFSTRKTFRTLLRLYRTRPFANEKIELVFSTGRIHTETNRRGAFYVKTTKDSVQGKLEAVVRTPGEPVKLMEGLYARRIHYMEGDTIVISDIDDTLLHSFIRHRLRKLRTLMFTTMEKREAVTRMQRLLKTFTRQGAKAVYLSNSEQNLYPLIYRTLIHNGFPEGPLFLKQMRRLRDVILNIKIPPKNLHKNTTLEELLTLFPEKKFILMGDNTQHDLPIYLSAAEKFGPRITHIIIRKVVTRASDDKLISRAQKTLAENGVRFYYADELPGGPQSTVDGPR